MSKGLSHWFWVVITASLFMVQPAMAAEGNSGQLVSV